MTKNENYARAQLMGSLKQQHPTVLIIGAGINGVGVFRDLAAQGLNVLLVDRADFASGASSASSHMAHGGIRYLENGEFRLVREAVQERNRLIQNAPHLVRPLPTAIPIFKFWSGLLNAPLKFFNLLNKPSERGALVIKLGLMLYDFFTRGQGTVPTHKFFNRSVSLEKWKKLNPAIQSTAVYYDGAILSPERLLTEIILDAEAEGAHARAINYLSFLGIFENKVKLRDELNNAEYEIAPQLIVNAAGAWIDDVNENLGFSHRYIGGTKGSHIILHNPVLREAIGKHEFFFENEDGRIVLIFPFYDKVLIGTTDIVIEDADSARCTDEEAEYLIKLVGRVFPSVAVSTEQIIFRYAGVRPLENNQAKTAGQITRDHSIKEDRVGDVPVFSLVGGKWTTYRAFAEQATNKVLEKLGSQRKNDTKSLQIGGGKEYPLVGYAKINFIGKVADNSQLASLVPKRLFERYGTRALEIARFMSAEPDADLMNLPIYTRREIEFLIKIEKCQRIDDIILRRSSIAWLGQVTLPLINELADCMADVLGWDMKRKQAEVERTVWILAERHGLSL